MGREMMVLFEQEHEHKKGFYEGKTENYIMVVCESERDLSGELIMVRLSSHNDGVMFGEIVS